MGSKELIANLFRISQTEEKLRKDVVDNAKTATSVHYSLGRSLLPMEIREGRLLFTPFGCSSNSIQPILSRLRREAGIMANVTLLAGRRAAGCTTPCEQ